MKRVERCPDCFKVFVLAVNLWDGRTWIVGSDGTETLFTGHECEEA